MDRDGGFVFLERNRIMRKRGYLIASLAMLLLLVLSGCKGNKLPDGMDEDKVSSAGLAVMSQLTKGEYEEVYDALREDVREQTSADAIEEMMDTATEGRGSFKKVKDSMVTGVTDADEPHAIAVIGAKYDKKSVVFRIAFDPEMNLIGLDVRGK
jgi:hypothetical protein